MRRAQHQHARAIEVDDHVGEVRLHELLLGAVAGYAMIAITAEVGRLIFKREAMGYGDAKLLAMIGALLGWKAVVFTFFVAPFFGLTIVLPLQLLQRKKIRGAVVPYGPFLAMAATVWVIFPPRSWPPLLRLLLP